jgi:predicted transglutaminase-like cysteine proteinase
MNTYITRKKSVSLSVSLTVIVFAAVMISQASYGIPFSLSEKLLREVQIQYGSEAEQRLREWQKIIRVTESSDDIEKLTQVNGFVNRAQQVHQNRHWRRSDDRADPLAFMINHAGDGQGFTMAKLFTLHKMGMPLSKLRIGYVKAHAIGPNQTQTAQSHTVLVYFSTQDAEPLILDNIDKRIRRASLRTDLEPVYLFEAQEILFPDSIASTLPTEKPRHVVKWQNLLPNLKTVHY